MGVLAQGAGASRPVVAIIGGAVSGAEAAGACTAAGVDSVVFEQNRRPYGKIEDGLPRWHDKLRRKEYERIDARLDQPGVRYVPHSALGAGLSLSDLRALGFSAVLLANGAWRDRPLGLPGADDFVGRGLAYQNPLVHWFNHQGEAGYDGPGYALPDAAIVVGGGLASVDVAKLINLSRYRSALAARGHAVSVVELEHAGIPAWLDAHGLSVQELGIAPATIYYRRRVRDMPVAFANDDSAEAVAKAEAVREKLVAVLSRKFLIRVEPCHRALSVIEQGGRMVGLRFARTEIVDGRVVDLSDPPVEVRSELVVSSIGSVPEPIDGIPMRGELYDFEDYETGALRGLPGVYGLGNVLTGKGNIKDSRHSAGDVTARLLAKGSLPPVDATSQTRIDDFVHARWQAVGYDGNYARWVAS